MVRPWIELVLCVHQEEGVACFKKALEFDPDCGMAHWGVAYAAGPFYNFPWCDFCDEELVACTRLCFDHVALAKTAQDILAPWELALA